MNSEADYTLCNLDSHHGYQNAYGSGTDIYGFHSLNGRSSLDTGQACGAYYSGDSLSPQLGTPGELPLGSGGNQPSMGYASAGVLSNRQSGRGAIHGYPQSIPAAHHHHQHHQQQQHQHHHHNGGGGQHHAYATHDLSMTTSTDCYTSSQQQHHGLSTAPNFLEIATVRSGYHTSSLDSVKYGSGSPGPGHLMGSPAGMTNGYLPAPQPTSSPLKSEVCTTPQGVQGKPFRWMTIKRNPTKPGRSINHPLFSPPLFTSKSHYFSDTTR
ncbi:homeotic protein deformed [Biomphalaria glabrata]|nr:homeotic protein deformed [Biomphalaria glabrata]